MGYEQTNNNNNVYGSPDYNYNNNNNNYSQPQQPNYGQQPNYPTFDSDANLQKNDPYYNNSNGANGSSNPYNNNNQQTVVVTHGKVPFQVGPSQCQCCSRQTATLVKTKNGSLVWLMCLLFFLLTGCLCCIPFFIDSWKDKEYRCEECNNIKFTEKGDC